MSFTETQILCQPNAWTQVAQLLDRRVCLRVQCPQVNLVSVMITVAVPAGGAVAVAIASQYRTQIAFQPDLLGQVKVTSDLATFTQLSVEQAGGASPSLIVQSPVFGQDYGVMINQAWTAQNESVVNTSTLTCFDTRAQCATLILSSRQTTKLVQGRYGAVPIGQWISPDLAAGPSQFELFAAEHGDLVTQAWFAWVVGSTSVTVVVLESFNDPPTADDDMSQTITVQMPELSPYGKKAAQELVAAMTEGGENEQSAPLP